jgi:ABC-2 type transport system permease protein
MNTQSDAVPESPLDSQRIAPAATFATRPLYWSIQRELWENRSIYLAPLGVASVFLLGFLISMIHLPAKVRGLSGLDPAQYREAVAMPYDFGAGLMMLTAILVSVFYSLDALHGERRDRSILFWKSLPVSDLTTVLAKASIPLVVLPLLTVAITAAMQFVMLLLSSAVLLGSGLSVAPLWRELPLLQMSLLMLYHVLTSHALWPAPIYCWLLLVSGWARRASFLWAALPLVAIAGLEKIAFHTSHLAAMVASRFIGAAPGVAITGPDVFPTDPMTHIMPGQFLSSPSLWIGLVVAAAFLAAAVRLRRYQGPI